MKKYLLNGLETEGGVVIRIGLMDKLHMFLTGSLFLSMGLAARSVAQPPTMPEASKDDKSPLEEMADAAGAITQKMAKLGNKPKAVAFQFFATHCPFCKEFDKVVESVKGRYSEQVEFKMVNVDDPANAELVSRFGVTQVPSMICVDDEGDKVAGLIGYTGADDVNWALYRASTIGQQASAAQ